MKRVLTPLALAACCALSAACGGGQSDTTAANARAGAAANSADAGAPKGSAKGGSGEIGVVSSHAGGAGKAQQQPASGGAGGDLSADRALADTKELDARIRKAAGRANAAGASAADKKEAASAHLARGNVYFASGQPRLYKFALADFKAVLRYDPANAEAREKIETIEDIYRGMGKPIPQVDAQQ